MYRRSVESRLAKGLESFPVVLLQGPRQSGKSTLAQMMGRAQGMAYFTFDDAGLLAQARRDPQRFVEQLPDRVILDEVQRAPEIFLPIKLVVDRDRRPGRFLLTGSANVLLLPRLSDSLAGRMLLLTLWPLSMRERQGKDLTKPSLVETLLSPEPLAWPTRSLPKADLMALALMGGFPEVVSMKDEGARREWFQSYLTTVTERDVRDLSNIEQWPLLRTLCSLLAARTGSFLNATELGRSLGLSYKTVQRYLTLLERIYLVSSIPGWFVNRDKRTTKSSKLYFNDSGLLGHLLGATTANLLHEPTLAGPLLETLVYNEIVRQASDLSSGVGVGYFRAQSQHEVDFVLEGPGGKVVGIEVKHAASVGMGELLGMTALKKAAGKRFLRGIVLHGGETLIQLDDAVWAMPASALWSGDLGVRRT